MPLLPPERDHISKGDWAQRAGLTSEECPRIRHSGELQQQDVLVQMTLSTCSLHPREERSISEWGRNVKQNVQLFPFVFQPHMHSSSNFYNLEKHTRWKYHQLFFSSDEVPAHGGEHRLLSFGMKQSNCPVARCKRVHPQPFLPHPPSLCRVAPNS